MKREKTWKEIIAFGLSLYSIVVISAVTNNLHKGTLVHEDLAVILLSVGMLMHVISHVLLTWPNKEKVI